MATGGEAYDVAIGEFDDGNIAAHRLQGGRPFQADEPTADDDDRLNSVQLGHDRVDIRQGANIMHAAQVRSRHGQRTHARAGRDNQFLVR